jgi:hypothetical protein
MGVKGGVQVRGDTLLLYLLLAAVVYLIYKVHQLERMLGAGVRRRKPLRGDPKVIPILKDEIPPGPFKSGTRRGREAPSPPTEPDR